MSCDSNLAIRIGFLLTALAISHMALCANKEGGPRTTASATEMIESANRAFNDGQYGVAISLAEQATKLRESSLGTSHKDYLSAMNSLGVFLRADGQLDKAEQTLQRVLTVRERVVGNNHLDTAETVNALAAVFYMKGMFLQAERSWKRSLAIREALLGTEHPDVAGNLSNLAIVYRETANYAQMESLLRRSMAIYEKTYGMNHSRTAAALNNLALYYADTGDYATAETLYMKVLAIEEGLHGPNHPDYSHALNNIGTVHFETGAYEKAKTYFARALTINERTLDTNHTQTALSISNLAGANLRLGNYSEVERLCQKAISMLDHQTEEHVYLAVSLATLGESYINAHFYSKARPLLIRALEIREKLHGSNHPLTADILGHLAKISIDTGALIDGERQLTRVFNIYQESLGLSHPSTGSALNALANVNWALGRKGQAISLFKRAQKISVGNYSRFSLASSEARKLSFVKSRSVETHNLVSFSVSQPEPQSVHLALDSVLQEKGRVLDDISGTFARLRQSIRHEDKELFERLAQVANQLSTLTYQGPVTLSNEDYATRVSQLDTIREKLEAELSVRNKDFRTQMAPASLASIQQALPRDSALVEYYRYEYSTPASSKQSDPNQKNFRYAAFVLSPRRTPIVVDLGSAEPIEQMARELRIALSDPDRQDVNARSSELYARLIAPLSGYIKGVRQLFVSPDGMLNLIPIGVLLDDSGRYLTLQVEVTYLTSARDILRVSNGTAPTTQNIAVVADPDFGFSSAANRPNDSALSRNVSLDRSGLVFRPLANTGLEAKDLKSLLKLDDSSLYTQGNATEFNLKQIRRPRLLHMATHGFFLDNAAIASDLGSRREQFDAYLEENPLLRSGIALSGANTRSSGPNEDGILTALEAAQLDLQGTELVVLSSCDSGVGYIQNGEGIYGLRRAIVLAGAQSQVTSLWKVSDEATRILMVDFYKRLLAGEGRSEALRHAQQRLLEDPSYSHPYYWASFVSIGNWNPLPGLLH